MLKPGHSKPKKNCPWLNFLYLNVTNSNWKYQVTVNFFIVYTQQIQVISNSWQLSQSDINI